MSELEIQDALNEEMLAASREAATNGQYHEAFEDILTVLSVDANHMRSHALLVDLTVSFLTDPRVTADVLPLMDPNYPDVSDLSNNDRFALLDSFLLAGASSRTRPPLS